MEDRWGSWILHSPDGDENTAVGEKQHSETPPQLCPLNLLCIQACAVGC